MLEAIARRDTSAYRSLEIFLSENERIACPATACEEPIFLCSQEE